MYRWYVMSLVWAVVILGGLLLFGLVGLDREDRPVVMVTVGGMAVLCIYLAVHGFDPMLGQGG